MLNIIAQAMPWIDNLTNLSNDTFYKAVEPYANLIGQDILFTLVFGIIGAGIFIGSERNIALTFAYFLMMTAFMSIIVHPIATLFFGIIMAFLGAGPIYRALVKKRG